MPQRGHHKGQRLAAYSRMPMLTLRWVDPIWPAIRVRSADYGEPQECTSRQHPELALCQRRDNDVRPRRQDPAKPHCSAHRHQA
eukprot:1387659-Pyramimonas_sp.AAC.1